jgi:hypothetical protein
MHRCAPRLILAVALLLALPLSAARAQSLLFDYLGFDYENPNPDVTMFGEPGSGYVGLGLVPSLFAPLSPDTAANEYTYVITGLISSTRSTFGDYFIVDYGTGTLSIYEDSKSTGTPADFGSNPPNPQAPSTFNDGTLFLQGTLSGFQFVYNTKSKSGSYEGVLDFTSGSQFGNLAPGQEKGWTFSGASGNALNIPPGYAHQVDGQAFVNAPLIVHRASWGAIKNVYRTPAATGRSGGAR